jgi:hypothetical protein
MNMASTDIQNEINTQGIKAMDIVTVVRNDGYSLTDRIMDIEPDTSFFFESIIDDQNDPQPVPFQELRSITLVDSHPTPNDTLVRTLKSLTLGQYLLIWRNTTTGGGNALAVQGTLDSIDFDKQTLVLKSKVYAGRFDTVTFDDIGFIDTSRSGSGALGPVQTPDLRNVSLGVWYRGNTEVK